MADNRNRLSAFDGKADIVYHLPAGTGIGKRQVLYPQLLYRHRWDGTGFILLYFWIILPKSPEIADIHGMLMQLEKTVLLIQQCLRYAEHRHDHPIRPSPTIMFLSTRMRKATNRITR